jgi:DNA invertase Pin-like site-specific DNA recombinase
MALTCLSSTSSVVRNSGYGVRELAGMLDWKTADQDDVLMVWSIDRLGRSALHVANAMAEMDAAGVALYSDQQAIDSTSPFGKAMMQMACVFGELEREMIRARVVAGLNRVREQGIKKLGRPQVGRKIEETIRRQLGAGHGILKVAKMVGCGSGTVHRVKREMAPTMAEAG